MNILIVTIESCNGNYICPDDDTSRNDILIVTRSCNGNYICPDETLQNT